MIKLFISFLVLLSYNLGCNGTQTEKIKDKNSTDTLQRPASISKEAVLLNFGSEEEPIMVWADYIGAFRNNGKEYPHIYGVQYYYVKADKTDTFYYENIGLRSGVIKFDFKNYSILNYPGEATIQVSNGKDSILLFRVIESSEFAREHRGIMFKRIPTAIKNNDGNYITDDEIEFNLKEINQGVFELTLNDGSKIQYKVFGDCKIKNPIYSFLNRQDGRIYFIDQDCYLELINRHDMQKFQGPK